MADLGAEHLAFLAKREGEEQGAWSREQGAGSRAPVDLVAGRGHAGRPRRAFAWLPDAAGAPLDRRPPAVCLGRAGAGRRAALGPGRSFSPGVHDLCHSAQRAGYRWILSAALGDRRGLASCAVGAYRRHPKRHPVAFARWHLPIRRGGRLLGHAFTDGTGRPVTAAGLPEFPVVVGAGIHRPVVFSVCVCRQCRAHLRHHRRGGLAGAGCGREDA